MKRTLKHLSIIALALLLTCAGWLLISSGDIARAEYDEVCKNADGGGKTHEEIFAGVDPDIIPAKCAELGSETYTCPHCKQEKVVPLTVLGHDFSVVTPPQAMKCEGVGEAGTLGYTKCSRCGEYLDGITPEKAKIEINHTITETVLQTASCDTYAIVKKECSKCDYEEIVQIEEFAHTWDAGTVTTPATCLKGEKTFKCTLCDATKKEAIEAVAEHAWVTDIAPTCIKVGWKGELCSVCLSSKNPEAPATEVGTVDHTPGESEVLPADCGNNEREVFYCSVCDKIADIVDLIKLGGDKATGEHTWTYTYDKEQTSNYTHKLTCSVCDVKDNVLCDLEEDKSKTVAATCAKDGEKTEVCVCGRAVKIELLKTDADHKQSISVLKPATCTVSGIGKYVCELCGVSIIPEDAQSEYFVITDGHTYGDAVITKAATCKAAGESKKTCTLCDKGVLIEKIDILEHKYEDFIVKAATCTEAGSKVQKCALCEEVEAESKEEIEQLKHDFVEKTIEPTCLKDGYKGMICSVCGEPEDEEALEILDADGAHIFDRTETLPADCGNNQRDAYYCKTCGEIYKYVDLFTGTIYEEDKEPVIGDPLNGDEMTGEHAYVYEFTGEEDEWTHKGVCTVCKGKVEEVVCETKEETVTAANCAVKSVVKISCKVCGHSDTKEGDVDSAKHDYEDVILKAATCYTSGIKKMVCTRCNVAPVYATISDGHAYGEVTVDTPATCEVGGKGTKTCGVCGGKANVVIDKLEHDLKVEITRAATCESTGLQVEKCAICNKELSTKVIAELPCDYKQMTIPATCVEDGKSGIFCTMCETQQPGTSMTTLPNGEGHKPGRSETLPADCGTNEREVTYCSVCGEICETIDLSKLGGDIATGKHTYVYTHKSDFTHTKICSVCEDGKENKPIECKPDITRVEPTCSAKGFVTEVCKLCGHKETKELNIDADAHKFAEVVLKAPTCTAGGVVKDVCEYCGKVGGYRNVEKKHTWDNELGVVKTPATCVKEGELLFTCTVCKQTVTTSIPKAEHSYGGDLVNKASTIVYKKCGVCGDIKITVDFVKKASHYDANAKNLGHTIIEKAAVPATPEASGTTAGKVCSGCDLIVEGVVEVKYDTCKHTEKDEAVKENEVAATCQKEGSYDLVVYCKACEAEVSRETKQVEKLAHDFSVFVEKIAPTETAGGYDTYKCASCDETTRKNLTDPISGSVKGTLTSKSALFKTASFDTEGVIWLEVGTEYIVTGDMTANYFYPVTVDGVAGYIYSSFIQIP